MTDSPRRRVPVWLKVGWTLWLAAWAPAYASHYGPQAFLWFCDLCNFALALALWTESRFLFSWQAVSVLLVQIVWTLDLASGCAFRWHFAAASNYMFDPAIPLPIRLLSLFHVAAAALLIWALRTFGYDRRAWLAQSLTALVVLPLAWLAGPKENLNWTWSPFGLRQDGMPPWAYLLLCMAAYPVVLYLPGHLLFRLWPGDRQPTSA
jgi:hypothetical protein